MTIEEAAVILAASGIDNPRREARLLSQAQTPDASLARLVERRAAREPMAFITGRQGFWTVDLDVSRDTLIPRPDSETLIEAAMGLGPARQSVRRVLDLGTGTGCLLLTILTEYPDAWGVGVDLAPGAALLAARNASRLGLGARAAFVAGDWAAALRGSFDLVLSNPPYVASGDIAGLMPEISRYEPSMALDGGADGLDAYRRIVLALPDLLTATGFAILELGAGQGTAVAALVRKAGLHPHPPRLDLAGVPRALVAAKIPFGGSAEVQ